VTIAAGLLAGGCALVPAERNAPRPDTAAPLGARCDRAYAALDRAVADAGVGDAMTARVDGFPWLRVDRFLASYRDPAPEGAAFGQWVDGMARFDREARAAEIANLPVASTQTLRVELTAQGFGDLMPLPLLEGCANVLRERDLASADAKARLVGKAVVPDAYETWMRVVGLYPVAAMPFAAGVRRYEAEVHAAFATPLDQLPVAGTLRTYRPRDRAMATPAEVMAILDRSRGNPLGIPEPTIEDLDRLFATYAPMFIVDERDGDDRIGRPTWRADGVPAIDTAAPIVYTRAAYTRFGGRALLQLVYTAWFPARPPATTTDPLAGRLDGVVWRVTLAADGTPLLFDTIHACGCYHLFFPTAQLTPRAAPPSLEEGALVPQALDRVPAGARIGLRLEAGTHYVRRVLVDPAVPADATGYALAADDALRSLPLPAGGRQSLYGPDGLVPGTERGERYVFWPMGIPSAGAMRQWGWHATAFVGRRHFDEPLLIERYFDAAREAR
jgi:hypothetical protein